MFFGHIRRFTIHPLHSRPAGRSKSDRADTFDAALPTAVRPSQSDTSARLAAGLPARPASTSTSRAGSRSPPQLSPAAGKAGGSGGVGGGSSNADCTSSPGSPPEDPTFETPIFGTAASAEALLHGIRSLAAGLDSPPEKAEAAEAAEADAAEAATPTARRTKSRRFHVRMRASASL